VQDTGAPNTHDKPGSLTCPVYSTDTREHLSWKEPVHTNYVYTSPFSNFSWCKGNHTGNPCVGRQVFYHRASPLTVVPSSVGESPNQHGQGQGSKQVRFIHNCVPVSLMLQLWVLETFVRRLQCVANPVSLIFLGIMYTLFASNPMDN